MNVSRKYLAGKGFRIFDCKPLGWYASKNGVFIKRRMMPPRSWTVVKDARTDKQRYLRLPSMTVEQLDQIITAMRLDV